MKVGLEAGGKSEFGTAAAVGLVEQAQALFQDGELVIGYVR